MSRLFLLRHAKAGWAEPGQRDFDRSLEPAGRVDAASLGRYLVAHDLVPKTIAASSSKRTRQTVDALSLPKVAAVFLPELYEATPVQALAIIHAQGAEDDLMIVGHNPIMEDLATALVRGGQAQAALRSGFPTCGLAIISFADALVSIQPGTGSLDAFLKPSDVN